MMKLFPVQKLVFDLDGTLVDTAPDLHAATNHVLMQIGRPPVPLASIRPYVGFGALRLMEEGLKLTGGVNGVKIIEYRDIFLEFYRRNIAVHSRLFPGGAALLHTLQNAGVQIAICTNKPVGLAEALLESLHLSPYFSVISGGDSYTFKKPDPRHLTETLKLMPGSGPALMVGDSSPDILVAKAANVPCVAALYGYADVPLMDLKPDATIKNLAELNDLMDF